MRMALFEISGVSCSVALDKVLHVMTNPHMFSLPLLNPCFAGALTYQGKVVPVLASEHPEAQEAKMNMAPAFTIVCEAEFGMIGVPADKIVRITKTGEVSADAISGCDSQNELCEVSGHKYRMLDLNRMLEEPAFTICGLRD